MSFIPLPYDEDMLSTFDPSTDTLYNEILLDSPSSPQPSSSSEFNDHEMAAIKEALDNLHNSDYSSIQPSPSPSPSRSLSPSPSLSPKPSPSPKSSPSPSSKFNHHEMAAIKEALHNLHTNEFISPEIVGMVHEGGQVTLNTSPPPDRASDSTKIIRDPSIQAYVDHGRISAGETLRSERRGHMFNDDFRANCSSEESCTQLRNYVGERLASEYELTYDKPGGPVSGTNSHPVPLFPGPCRRKVGSEIIELASTDTRCQTLPQIVEDELVVGGKTRSSRRSGKKNSPPSRMSRRTRRSRRSTRKAGRKGRRATRRSRK